MRVSGGKLLAPTLTSSVQELPAVASFLQAYLSAFRSLSSTTSPTNNCQRKSCPALLLLLGARHTPHPIEASAPLRLQRQRQRSHSLTNTVLRVRDRRVKRHHHRHGEPEPADAGQGTRGSRELHPGYTRSRSAVANQYALDQRRHCSQVSRNRNQPSHSVSSFHRNATNHDDFPQTQDSRAPPPLPQFEQRQLANPRPKPRPRPPPLRRSLKLPRPPQTRHRRHTARHGPRASRDERSQRGRIERQEERNQHAHGRRQQRRLWKPTHPSGAARSSR